VCGGTGGAEGWACAGRRRARGPALLGCRAGLLSAGVLRARIVLECAVGVGDAEAAGRLGVSSPGGGQMALPVRRGLAGRLGRTSPARCPRGRGRTGTVAGHGSACRCPRPPCGAWRDKAGWRLGVLVLAAWSRLARKACPGHRHGGGRVRVSLAAGVQAGGLLGVGMVAARPGRPGPARLGRRVAGGRGVWSGAG
jgi:hypothetical protein